MENNLLLKYMNDRIRPVTRKVVEAGPVITISRECGCSGRSLAEKLTEQINKKINDPAMKWKWVSKEILGFASEQLKIHPDKIKELLNAEEKNFLEEIASSFTDKYYIYDAKIRKVIEEVVRGIAVRGKVVIVGRGSDTLTHGIPLSLHVKLVAPLAFRVTEICRRKNISPAEARRHIIKIDNQRAKFREAYSAKNPDTSSHDIEFNCARFSHEEIVEVIMNIAGNKSLF